MIFKDIPGYEGIYQVSECGQVKSLKFGKEKILKPGLNSSGYENVSLCKDGVEKKHRVHRLVMYTHSHVETDLTVNHIDENKRNNHISNLEYCTRGENVRKYNRNNPDKVSERGKINGEKASEFNKERCGHKYLDTNTGIIYASMREVGVMMSNTGEATSWRIWWRILQNGLPQDRFVRI